MPRKPREKSSTGIYHIILRSVNQHIIFEEDADYQKFLYILSDCKIKYDIDIYAYCLMDNHIHLLIFSPPDILSHFFQSLGTRFAQWYNNKYDRSGHLFQDRFHSTAVANNAQYLATLIYIHNNPTKANMCRYPSEYRWSSYNAFYGQKNPLISTAFSINIAGSKDSLLRYFATHSDSEENSLFVNDHKDPRHFLTDEQALIVFRDVTNLPSTSAVSTLPRKIRNEYVLMLKDNQLTLRQIARLMGISLATVKRVCKK